MKYSNSIQLLDHENITINDTTIVSNGIIEENKKEKHMIERTPDELLSFAKQYGGMVAKDKDGRLAGFITFSPLDREMNLYERGSLLVFPEYRGLGIADVLIRSITERYRELAILSVTNVPSIIKINSRHSEQIELLRKNIPERLIQIIEGPLPLNPNDRVFINRTLGEQIVGGKFGFTTSQEEPAYS